jgi:glycosidase
VSAPTETFFRVCFSKINRKGGIVNLFATRNSQPATSFDFHVSRKARDRYQFDLSMFSISGKVIFTNIQAARTFAQKMNEKRDVKNYPELAVSAGEINAMGLIHEILHAMIEHYRQEAKTNVFSEALERMEKNFSRGEIDKLLRQFVEEFPPVDVYQQKITIKEYLQGESGGISNRQIALEEMLLLWLENGNPAFMKYNELFDDEALEKETVYMQVMDELDQFFDEQPLFGPAGNQNLLRLLRSPTLLNPHSLSDQLRFMQQNWGGYLAAGLRVKWELLPGESGAPLPFEMRLLRTLDFITEEQKMRFLPGAGAVETFVPDYAYQDAEPERYSRDTHWMPRLVLLAKSALVWLDQLSRKYQKSITRLDQIPDEEIDILARQGFTGLWLIGIWERSNASKKIKQMCGNPEAESSAYSLYDYQIANDLGGDEAYEKLKERCGKRGIRLGSDMVPNHTGIYSKWVIEHPDWYVQLPYPPFPGYTFKGADLSEQPDVGIYIEDHYYDRSDAAVVFKRVYFPSGESRYIYHGNDGTSFPWNDTAQLDYTKPEVREAVIQTILHVARQFPIIRFDAAMTLAKRHYHRLWFPAPGSGGDIPSRSQYGMTRAQFDKLVPEEFWREVVDRVAAEAPDTLLLAEAFWLMEGYFVRTLGMHRVYNSAFMNMLKKEENKKYRYTIKNTIEFDPEVLKRFVNFMNNPDEETAIYQFGDGDKYFGVCMMMCTMPGLPMFGHGQVEGLREKYGMEYRRAYYEEEPNQYLVERHEREIFPIMKKRHLFAEVENFLLYDLYNEEGAVDENVYAYSNRLGKERALVVFHNKYASTAGWIRTSAAYAERTGNGEKKRLRQKTLGEGLTLPDRDNDYIIFRDQISGLEYIRHCKTLQEHGFFVELGAYKYHVFLDFREVRDSEYQQYNRLYSELEGRGVPSIEEAIQEMYLQPLHEPFHEFMNVNTLGLLIQNHVTDERGKPQQRRGDPQQKRGKPDEDLLEEVETNYLVFLEEAHQFVDFKTDALTLAREVRRELAAAMFFTAAITGKRYALPKSAKFKDALGLLEMQLAHQSFSRGIILSWVFVHNLGKFSGEEDYPRHSRILIDEWLLHKIIRHNLQQLGLEQQQQYQAVALIKLLTRHQNWFEDNGTKKNRAYRLLDKLFSEEEFKQFAQVNRFDNVLWFNKEAFEIAANWLFTIGALQIILRAETSINKNKKTRKAAADSKLSKTAAEKVGRQIVELYEIVEQWRKAEAVSEYKVEKLLEGLKSAPSRVKKIQKTKKKS